MSKKSVSVRVRTMDAELEFFIEPSTIGHQLINQVAKTINLPELWFFGLQFENEKGLTVWLRLNKKILSQDLKKDTPHVFYFLVKFYPENLAKEIKSERALQLLYLQVKNSIESGQIACPPDIQKLLESKGNDKLEYLKGAQDNLKSFGVTYFTITDKKGVGMLLGVHSQGIRLCPDNDKLTPTSTLPWGEIRNVSFNDKKFIIKRIDKKAKDLLFFSSGIKVNKMMLALCMGNHELFMRRENKPEAMQPQLGFTGAEAQSGLSGEYGKAFEFEGSSFTYDKK